MPQKFIIPTPTPGPFLLGQDSHRQPGVPEGTVTKHEWRSEIFPGTVRPYWIYVPAQYKADKPACVYVGLDSLGFNVPVVFDNLINKGEMISRKFYI